MSLVLYRVDDRLIHGQVVVGWGQALDLGFIVLVDDTVAKSDWERELYRMGVPRDMEVYFHSAGDAPPSLPRYRQDPRAGILLTGDVDTMRALAAGGGIGSINVGGIHHRADRTRRLRYVFLSPAEESALREMAAHGILITAQDVPSARAVPLNELLNGQGSP